MESFRKLTINFLPCATLVLMLHSNKQITLLFEPSALWQAWRLMGNMTLPGITFKKKKKKEAPLFKISSRRLIFTQSFLRAAHNPPECSITVVKPAVRCSVHVECIIDFAHRVYGLVIELLVSISDCREFLFSSQRRTDRLSHVPLWKSPFKAFK